MLRFLDSFLLSKLSYRFLKCIIVLLSISSTQCAHSCNGNKKWDILYLFDRPGEPAYMPKGENKVAFDVPACYLPESYQSMANPIKDHFAGETALTIPVKQISLPDLSIPLQLGRREPFSFFIPEHRKLAARLIDIFSCMRTYEDFLSVAVYCHERVNPQMFIYTLSVAMMNRPDTKNLPIPPLSQIFPDKYIDSEVLSKAKEQAYIVPAGWRKCIEIPHNHNESNTVKERRLDYFREDMGINLHHWHWHLNYPFESNDIDKVNKSRRGELFYHMHHQILARYDCERHCNGLSRVKSLDNLTKPIPEGYFPKLDSLMAGHAWSSRQPGTILKDINRPNDNLIFTLQELAILRDRIFEAIHNGGYISPSGDRVPLTEFGGVDVLGNIIEATILTPNRQFYGDIHNYGHVAIAYCNNPNGTTSESPGVMADSATAMRDPVFYRYHSFVDKFFIEHKNTLLPYSLQQLDFPCIKIMKIEVQTPNQEANLLLTFWTISNISLSRGLDFTPRGDIDASFTHLNHAKFKYKIVVNNCNNTEQKGTVRIFIAPRKDERGLPYPFREQKELMIEMDKFTVILKPGQNVIERNSTESSVTISFEKTFRNLDENRPFDGDKPNESKGCGWPQHMLVPKGTKEGFPMDLFIMISDYAYDKVDQDESIGDATSICGLRDRKYPDARSMGYPFDRRPGDGVKTLAQFLTGNMAVTPIIIRHMDTVLPREQSIRK